MRIKIKSKAVLLINGTKYIYEPGEYELDEHKAKLLIAAGYAEKINLVQKEEAKQRGRRVYK